MSLQCRGIARNTHTDRVAERGSVEDVAYLLVRCLRAEGVEYVFGIPGPFAKGMGIAAPQIGIARAAAVVLPPDDAPAVILLNPRITDCSEETDEQYEGCLSFFDVRGLVPRPLTITVEAATPTGETTTTIYERGIARLIHHEIDRLDGLLYTARMRTGVEPIPVEEHRRTGRAWAYE
ncbi:peptide deformylase [Streptomyces sp. IMTB 2501]|uniref:peptide deformylase n=1 Tax=Streptomyces sp. IMTB 2501 TaxID=1776340 RepID=UPI002116DA7B|nr:peptide deformylase [Streptomyces sp. IMTB 2501]